MEYLSALKMLAREINNPTIIRVSLRANTARATKKRINRFDSAYVYDRHSINFV